MRSINMKALKMPRADPSDRTQPEAGEQYIVCKHIRGNPHDGFVCAHVIRNFDLDSPVIASTEGALEDVVARDIRPAWYFLCGSCLRSYDSGSDGGQIVGSDGSWPVDAKVDYRKEKS